MTQPHTLQNEVSAFICINNNNNNKRLLNGVLTLPNNIIYRFLTYKWQNFK